MCKVSTLSAVLWLGGPQIIFFTHGLNMHPNSRSGTKGGPQVSPGNRTLRFSGGSRTQLRSPLLSVSGTQSTTCPHVSFELGIQVTSRALASPPATVLTNTLRGAELGARGREQKSQRPIGCFAPPLRREAPPLTQAAQREVGDGIQAADIVEGHHG